MKNTRKKREGTKNTEGQVGRKICENAGPVLCSW